MADNVANHSHSGDSIVGEWGLYPHLYTHQPGRANLFGLTLDLGSGGMLGREVWGLAASQGKSFWTHFGLRLWRDVGSGSLRLSRYRMLVVCWQLYGHLPLIRWCCTHVCYISAKCSTFQEGPFGETVLCPASLLSQKSTDGVDCVDWLHLG